MLLVVLWMPPLNLSDLFFLELDHVLSRLVDTVELVGLCLVFAFFLLKLNRERGPRHRHLGARDRYGVRRE